MTEVVSPCWLAGDGAVATTAWAEFPETLRFPTTGVSVRGVVEVLGRALDTVSLVAEIRDAGEGLADGKRSCEIAMTTSERNRARKKRLSIQGTGS
jgi:hypothetical protein